MTKCENPCVGQEKKEADAREKLERKEREWRRGGYSLDQAEDLVGEYRAYLASCYGPDEYDEPDEFGLYRRQDAVVRGADFGLADRYFALAQEMALRYLSRKFRAILRSAFETAKEFARYEYYYSGMPGCEEKQDRLERAYEECCERERQVRKRLQESSCLTEGYCRGCVELTAILKQASREELERVPKKLLDFFERNCDPYYEFVPGEGKRIGEMELLPETKGLLAMLYRNYWCADGGRQEFDRLLVQNDRRRQNLDPIEDEAEMDEEIRRLEGLFIE